MQILKKILEDNSYMDSMKGNHLPNICYIMMRDLKSEKKINFVCFF